MKNRITALFMIVCVVLSMASCSGDNSENETKRSNNIDTTETTEKENKDDESKTENVKNDKETSKSTTKADKVDVVFTTKENIKTTKPSKKEDSTYGIVPDGPQADKSYFDDAVFIGDSISVKLQYYQAATGALGKAKVYAASSLSAANALWDVSSKSVHPLYQGKKTLVEDCVQYSKANKLFIMLGMNDIGTYPQENAIKNYKELLRRVLAKSPDIEIFVQSVTPLTASSPRADSKLNNKTIKEYNKKLEKMCKENDWNFVNVASCLYDSTGTALKDEYCSDKTSMGLHFTDAGCEQWVKYLKSYAAGK